jgi:hypothetical protein
MHYLRRTAQAVSELRNWPEMIPIVGYLVELYFKVGAAGVFDPASRNRVDKPSTAGEGIEAA